MTPPATQAAGAEHPPRPITLRVNGRDITAAAAPTDRLLDLLRIRLGLTGTKEGCGEGECGACTVHLDGVPVNSCLIPARQARGRDIRTVESLDPADLGPLVASGATQCGACTPGVAMAAAWILEHPEVLDDGFTIRQIMAGNLCRCTGYDGIIQGIEAALAAPPRPDAPASLSPGGAALSSPGREPRVGGGCASASPGGATHEHVAGTSCYATGGADTPPRRAQLGTAHCVRGSFGPRIVAPATLADALSLLAADPSLIPLAGGTDLLVRWPTNTDAHDRAYLDLSTLDDLRRITRTDTHLTLGALATYWDVLRDPRTCAEFPLLPAAARQVGAIQIQSRGTWAGNIANASPAADGVPVLMACDATVVLRSAAGEREVRLDQYFTGYRTSVRRPDELITAIRLPRREYGVNIFEKVGPRRAQAITKVGVAITCERPAGPGSGRWRVVANSVAPTVRRCPAIEAVLADAAPVASPDDLLPAIRRDTSPIDDIRSTAAYRERVLARVIYHALLGVHPSFSGPVGRGGAGGRGLS